LGVVFQSRFLPAVQLLKRELEHGRLGRIFMADAYVKWYREPSYYGAARWRGTLALDGGGALINQSIHTVDLLQHLAGPAASVFGQTGRMLHEGIEGEDTAVAVVRFASGAFGVIQGSTALYPGFSRRVEIHGEEGSVILEGNDIREWRLRDQAAAEDELGHMAAGQDPGGASDPTRLDVAGHRSQVEDFVEAVRDDRPPAVDGAEGLKALAIVLAIYRSSREGRPVAL
jgi:UDP-N-acetyl-2-amino-2-deoxyglucuronate dehydrogenase